MLTKELAIFVKQRLARLHHLLVGPLQLQRGAEVLDGDPALAGLGQRLDVADLCLVDDVGMSLEHDRGLQPFLRPPASASSTNTSASITSSRGISATA